MVSIFAFFATWELQGSIPRESTMIKIYRKQGWDLNPNDLRLNNIIRAILRNNGNCPCQKGIQATCPCEEYRDNDNCHCGLYVKVNNHELVHKVDKE